VIPVTLIGHGNDREATMTTCEKRNGENSQRQQLEDWCLDFEHFFGWPVHVIHEDKKTMVEIEASKYDYGLLLADKTLRCVVKDKKNRRTKNGTDWEFSFNAFARMMLDILARESKPRRSEM
jgi:hypothetical protein